MDANLSMATQGLGIPSKAHLPNRTQVATILLTLKVGS